MKYFGVLLNPCPFCQCTKIGLKAHDVEEKSVFWLFCHDCQASGPIQFNEADAIRRWGLQPGFDFEAFKKGKDNP